MTDDLISFFNLARISKYLKLMADPRYWPALCQGVAATVEHATAIGGDEFATVIDVGSNKGQFAVYARTRWPHARLVCFEPLSKPRDKLTRVTRGQAEIYDCALGMAAGEAIIHIASRTDSSSMLALGMGQKTIFGMKESGLLAVPIQRLDACLTAPLRRPALLKIDVQGYELEVLKGASGLLPQIDVIYVEASFLELYDGQALYADIECFLSQSGFGLQGQFNTYHSCGQPVQADMLFWRTTVMATPHQMKDWLPNANT